ncbi:cobalamin-binding protein [Leptospira sp. GIMC2001]|uniref:cobalamin-binding protein n=1 Tax=Leptospira sp. GIMC2001 TaxID=1513297 RepID=UPI00234BE645|nr:cobalamin-binding protein [Leptospira sp. GIMC2001]WCL49434.1 cobalamin-binding protein [Leptospira sp. GIMC2001]
MNYPQKIICLTEETTELFYLLGEQKRIAGVTTYTVRPKQAKQEKPIVSSFISGNIKKIKSLNPDLIIGFSDIQGDLARDLIKEGLNVFITNQRSIEEIFQTMILLGSLVGRTTETIHLVDQWKMKIDDIKNSMRIYKYRPRIFFQEWNEPIITGIKWVSELIQICGGEDAFDNLKEKSLAKDRIISGSDVENENPDIIIGSWCGKPVDFDWVRNHTQWQDVNAIKNNQIYEIDSSIILQPGPALFIDALDSMSSIVKKYHESEANRSPA